MAFLIFYSGEGLLNLEQVEVDLKNCTLCCTRDREVIVFMLEHKKNILVFLIVLYFKQKFVPWFNEGQEFLFLSSPLLPILSSPMITKKVA